MLKRAVILSGSLGMGHHVLSEVITESLGNLGWDSRTLDCMAMLGPWAGRAGDWAFRRLMAAPGLYDGLHFAHLRAGSRLAAAMDGAATSRLADALRGELRREPADLIISVFAAGVPAAAGLAAAGVPAAGPAGPAPLPRTIVFCPDAMPHATWVRPGIDLFLVTSAAAEAGVRRYLPRARVAVVPSPVRPAFRHPPPRPAARSALGIPAGARCVLLMGGGWGLGPVEGAARALAGAGVHVLAVAGHNRRLAARLEFLAASSPLVHPYGFTPRIVELMSASDLVVTLPGALTCGEARAVGRPLMLLDAMPGHGRENLQHELERGGAEVCDPRPADLTATVLAALDRMASDSAGRDGTEDPLTGASGPRGDWDQAFAQAMASVGLGDLRQAGAASGRTAPGCTAPGRTAADGPASGERPHAATSEEAGYR